MGAAVAGEEEEGSCPTQILEDKSSTGTARFISKAVPSSCGLTRQEYYTAKTCHLAGTP